MRCTYPAIFEKNELGGYSIHFPDFPECYTDGDSFEDAIEMASEAMELVVESYVDNGRPLPSPSLDCNPPEGKRLVYISSDVDLTSRTVSAHAAASLLGVSDARVRQLIGAGALKAVKQGRDSYVYLRSVRDRLNNPVPPGRPAA